MRREVYSIWLMPEGRVAAELQGLIKDLSTRYKTPEFQPHITLIGELNLSEAEAIRGTTAIARKIDPFRIKLGRVTYLNHFFRCVFIKAYITEALAKAHEIACRVFKQEPNEEFMPHLSLVYGDLSQQTKHNIIRDIGNKMDFEFRVKNLYLYYTGGRPRDWHSVLKSPCGLQNV